MHSPTTLTLSQPQQCGWRKDPWQLNAPLVSRVTLSRWMPSFSSMRRPRRQLAASSSTNTTRMAPMAAAAVGVVMGVWERTAVGDDGGDEETNMGYCCVNAQDTSTPQTCIRRTPESGRVWGCTALNLWGSCVYVCMCVDLG
jgi:hypothetical protein